MDWSMQNQLTTTTMDDWNLIPDEKSITENNQEMPKNTQIESSIAVLIRMINAEKMRQLK